MIGCRRIPPGKAIGLMLNEARGIGRRSPDPFSLVRGRGLGTRLTFLIPMCCINGKWHFFNSVYASHAEQSTRGKLVVDVWTETMSKHGLDNAVLCSAYPVHGLSASEVNCFVAGAQVFSFHCRTVVFHHLTIFVPLDVFSGLASSSLL